MASGSCRARAAGLDSVVSAASDIANKLDRLPIEEIAANLNRTLRSASTAVASVGDLAKSANSGLSPTLARLPGDHVGARKGGSRRPTRVLTSVDRGYGQDSEIQRELTRAMAQVGGHGAIDPATGRLSRPSSGSG